MLAYIVACGDDDDSSSVKDVAVPEIESSDDLDSCGTSNEGDTVYVAEEDAYLLCHESEWTKIDIPDSVEVKTEKKSSSSEKSSSSANSSSSAKSSSSSEADSLMSKYVDECDEKKTPDVCTNNKDGIGIIKACIKGRLIEYSCRTAGCNEKGDDCDMNMSRNECTEDTPSVCTNNEKGIGIIKTCVRGQLIEYSCQSVSCNEEGTDCGECVNNVSTCTDDKDFRGTLTKCENGKKKEQKCGNVSCDGDKCGTCRNYDKTCENDESGVGTMSQCVNGKPSSVMTEQCEHGFSCKRTKVGENAEGFWQMKFTRCGECLEGELKCDNDPSGNGVMYRCYEGEWHEINGSDGFSTCMYGDDGYLILDTLENGSYVCGKRFTTLDTGRYNHKSFGRYSDITLTGYYPITQKVQTFTTTMAAKDANWNSRVSCDADGKMLGVCHNSIRLCVNEERGKNGYLIVCQGGRLMDFDGDGDNIACHCQEYGNNNGGCSSGSNCYAGQTAVTGMRMCQPPRPEDKTGFEIEDDPDYEYGN